MSVPRLFDQQLLIRRRERAARAPDAAFFLHEEVARRLVERLDDIRRPFAQVLDLGCGPGFLAQRLERRAGTLRVIRLDPSHAMVRRAGGMGVVAGLEALPFAPDRFDAVLSAFALHWVNDLPGLLAQIRLCLKPDGLLLLALAGGETLGELAQALWSAELALYRGMRLRLPPRIDLADAAALLQRAGFALPVADLDRITVRYADPLALLQDLHAMGESQVLRQGPKGFFPRRLLALTLQHYRDRFRDGEGRVPASFEILYLTGWKPHPDQPRPLPRGSGQVSLARLLGGRRGGTG